MSAPLLPSDGPKHDPDGVLAAFRMITGIRAESAVWMVPVGVIFVALGGVALWHQRPTGDDENALLTGGLSLATMGAAALVTWLVVLVRWLPYRDWRFRTPFSVEGQFDVLATAREGLDGWRETVVELKLVEPDAEAEQKASAALRAFAGRADTLRYKARVRDGVIPTWQVKGLRAEGAANARVAWTLYRFVSQDLVRAARTGLRIERVLITVGPSRTYERDDDG